MGTIKKNQLGAIYETIVRLVIVLSVSGAIMLLCGCKSVSRVEGVGYRIERDTVMQTRWRTDSVVMHDSVVIVDSGERRVERVVQWRYRLRTITDTAYISKTDSVPVPYAVEKKLGKWEQAKVDYGGYAISALIIIAVIAIWLCRRRVQQ